MSILPIRMTDTQREQELAQLMADYKTQLMRIAYMYLGDEALAEDAVQDTGSSSTLVKMPENPHGSATERAQQPWMPCQSKGKPTHIPMIRFCKP